MVYIKCLKRSSTVIREFSLLKFFRFAQNNENFLRENCLLVILYVVNIWCAFDMNENIVTRKFLTQNFCERN